MKRNRRGRPSNSFRKDALFSSTSVSQLELLSSVELEKLKPTKTQIKKCPVSSEGSKCKICKILFKCKTDTEDHMKKEQKYLPSKKDNKISGQSEGNRLHLTKLNDQLTCTLCTGYIIDGTTIIECLHSFCSGQKTKPVKNIRPDPPTLQDIVYKLDQNEMQRRREFYAKHPEGKNSTMSPESRGKPIESCNYSPDDVIRFSLEHFSLQMSSECEDKKERKEIVTEALPKRYFCCLSEVPIFHLQKLIRAKHGLSEAQRVDILYKEARKEELLCGSASLLDVMHYHWSRNVLLRLSYRIFESSPKRIKLSEDNKEFSRSLSNTGIGPLKSKEDQPKRAWKEVQLKISVTDVRSFTDISSADSKKCTKEIDGQSSSELLENLETLRSMNKPKIALEDETVEPSESTNKSKNLTEDDKNITQESEQIVKEVEEVKEIKEKEVKEKQVKEVKKNGEEKKGETKKYGRIGNYFQNRSKS